MLNALRSRANPQPSTLNDALNLHPNPKSDTLNPNPPLTKSEQVDQGLPLPVDSMRVCAKFSSKKRELTLIAPLLNQP